VFQLYSNLIVEKARQPWTKIMSEQIDAAPWTDIQGVEHADQCCKSWYSFMECVRFHLLTIFCNDAAETKRYYISNCLKKPNWVPIRQFVQRVQQLNGYYSPQAVTSLVCAQVRGKPSTTSLRTWYLRVFISFLNISSALRRPFPPRRSKPPRREK